MSLKDLLHKRQRDKIEAGTSPLRTCDCGKIVSEDELRWAGVNSLVVTLIMERHAKLISCPDCSPLNGYKAEQVNSASARDWVTQTYG